MNTNRKFRRLTRLSVISTVCCLTVGLLGITAAPVSAAYTCPGGGFEAGNIDYWDTNWPDPQAPTEYRGVTLCEAKGGLFSLETYGFLQIIDLSDGAKIRLMSQADENSPTPSPYESNTTYTKRTAEEWYGFLKYEAPYDENLWAYQIPDSINLFSTVNGSFMKDTDNGDPTTVPFPHWFWGGDSSFGVTADLAVNNPNLPDWTAPKRYLAIQSPWEDPQVVKVGYFPTYYDWQDTVDYLAHVGGDPYNFDTADAVVGFSPSYEIGNQNYRNYLGVDGDAVFIFTSNTLYTNAEAEAIMEELDPNMDVIQLDGGGSTQLYAPGYGEIDSSAVPDRQVADVLAVYLAPIE